MSVEKNSDFQIKKIFLDLTGFKIKSFSHPGLEDRDNSGNKVLLITSDNDQKFILTFRHNLAHAKLEAEVLKRISREKGPVPNLLNSSGHWLVQEYITGNRLSSSLNTKNKNLYSDYIYNGISSLIHLQEIAKKIHLGTSAWPICSKTAWKELEVSSLSSISNLTRLPLPRIDKNKIIDLLTINPSSFIKWDARPGNAIVGHKQRIFWIDWEHSGLRAGIDDLIWFLTDEWVSLKPQVELEIISEFINYFNDEEVSVSLERYLWVFGTTHMCGKLLKIIEHQKKINKWQERSFCLTFELMGVTLQESQNLATKAARWAGQDKLTRPLVPWLENVNLWLAEQ
jgi:thiamine kinase-like enzyme